MADVDATARDDDSMAMTPFVAALMEKSLTETFRAGNEVAASYKRQAERAKAELELIRRRISALIGGRWMPTTHAIEFALWPTTEEIDDEWAATVTEGATTP